MTRRIMKKRNQRNKSARNTARRNRLATLRAELMLTLENEVKPHHLAYNARKTEQLIREFREFKRVPLWAEGYVKQHEWMNTPADGWIYDDKNNHYADAVVHGLSIYKMVMPST